MNHKPLTMLHLNFVRVTAALLVSGAIFVACNSASTKEEPAKPSTPMQADLVKRGEYLVNGMGCDDCHSPKRMGAKGPELIPELRLSGYPSTQPLQKPDSNVVKKGWMLFSPDLTAAVGPWGVSFSANLTSDGSGIGNWTEQQFITAIRKGKAKGLENNRDLLPPMPWFNYRNLSDEDLKSIFAYLKTVPPVSNAVPAPKQIADIK